VEAAAAVTRSPESRFEDQQRLAELLAVREPLYAEVAHLRVNTDGRSPAEVADLVLAPEGPAR
jgi:shikimate kinase